MIILCNNNLPQTYHLQMKKKMVTDFSARRQGAKVSAMSKSTTRAKRKRRAHSKRSRERWAKLTSCIGVVIMYVFKFVILHKCCQMLSAWRLSML